MAERTLHDVLRAAPPTCLTFPANREEITLADLCAQAEGFAGALAAAGVRHGDRVGVLCANDADFFRVLIALSMLGACACPLSSPATGRDGYAAKIRGIVTAAGIGLVVVSARMARMRSLLADALAGTVQVTTDDLRSGSGFTPGTVLPGDDLVVQFTSGSTAAPKGVRLSHANVLACLKAIVHGMALGTPGDHAGNWLPLYHDMGLFGSLAALSSGVPLTVWPPSVFVKDPAEWLREVEKRRITACALPNFAYDYLLRAVGETEVATYDLSRWRVSFNGAEPIAVDTVETFLSHFAPAGFRPATMMPVYGLAEATLAVTFPPLGRPVRVDWVDRARLSEHGRAVPVERSSPSARGVVAVGRPVLGLGLRIIDPGTGARAGDREVGEVQIRGASVTAGYLDADEQPFTADGWLRTGDLGYLAGGELHVTGRLKELIILRGENFYPEDVEDAVRTDPGVHRRRCVAFVDDLGDGEHMTLVAETTLTAPAERDGLSTRLRQRVADLTGLDDLRVVLVMPQSIPRTSSGKLQRLASRGRFSRS